MYCETSHTSSKMKLEGLWNVFFDHGAYTPMLKLASHTQQSIAHGLLRIIIVCRVQERYSYNTYHTSTQFSIALLRLYCIIKRDFNETSDKKRLPRGTAVTQRPQAYRMKMRTTCSYRQIDRGSLHTTAVSAAGTSGFRYAAHHTKGSPHLGTSSPFSFPSSIATHSSSLDTVGSSPKTSSPTLAPDMAALSLLHGRVTVSLRKSMFDESVIDGLDPYHRRMLEV